MGGRDHLRTIVTIIARRSLQAIVTGRSSAGRRRWTVTVPTTAASRPHHRGDCRLIGLFGLRFVESELVAYCLGLGIPNSFGFGSSTVGLDLDDLIAESATPSASQRSSGQLG